MQSMIVSVVIPKRNYINHKRNTKRKDKSRKVLRKGESQRTDGTYQFRWTDENRKRHCIYARNLDDLRCKEDEIDKDKKDGIKAEARYTFVSLKGPYKRMKIGGIEVRLREMGKRLNIEKVHPHKFRRTLATVAIDKGMPIEQLQKLLGHQRIDTTLQYAMVKQSNVKIAHRKYIG